MKIRTTSRISLLTATAAILAIGAIPVAHAANIWDGGAGTGNWNDANNWDNNTVPSVGGNPTFAGDVQTVTSNNISSFTASGFFFTNNGTVGTSSFTLGGNGITSSAAFAITTTALTAGSALTDIIDLNIAGGQNITVTANTSHNVTINGVVSGGRSIIKTGAGNLTLTNAANSFTGGVNLNQGALIVNSATGIADIGTNSALGANGTLKIGNASADGTLNFLAGAASSNRQVTIGATTITATGGAIILNNSANGSNPLVFTNAAFNVTANSSMTASRLLTLGGSNTDANAINGAIIDNNTAGGGTIRVTKTDAGKWILSGTNTYTGNTTVSAGTLLINGNQIASTGAVNVSGATSILGGNGTIGGAVAIGANSTLSPGNSPGLLTMNSTLTLSSVDSKLNFEIATGARGTNYDAVNVTGLLTYNGDLTLTIGATIADGTYDLFGGAAAGALSQTGSFDTIAFAGGAYSGSWVNNSGIWTVTSAGQNFTFTQSTGDLVIAVPEPATWALLTTSLAGLLIFRRRQA